jgi:hypothetical protein
MPKILLKVPEASWMEMPGTLAMPLRGGRPLVCGPCLYRLKPHILNFGEFFMDRQILDQASTLPMPLRGGGLWF